MEILPRQFPSPPTRRLRAPTPLKFQGGGIEFAGGGAYCTTKNDGISERKFRHKSPATINFMALPIL
jgi:hypothetical protein